jgi:hypothetical protein
MYWRILSKFYLKGNLNPLPVKKSHAFLVSHNSVVNTFMVLQNIHVKVKHSIIIYFLMLYFFAFSLK